MSFAVPAPLLQLGAGGIVTLTVVLILLGRLVPYVFYKRALEDNEKLKEAHIVKDQTILELTLQTRELQAISKAWNGVIDQAKKEDDG